MLWLTKSLEPWLFCNRSFEQDEEPEGPLAPRRVRGCPVRPMPDVSSPLRTFMDEQKAFDLYTAYIQAFEKKDYVAIADRCRTPFFASSSSGTTVFNEREELVQGFSML